MKRAFLLIIVCTLAFISAHAQNSSVEATSQLTKAEQFKNNNSFIKEATIYEDKASGMKLYAKLFTDLNSGEQLAALEIWPTTASKLLTGGVVSPLGYLDLDQIDDLLLALETIQTESSQTDKKDNYSITYKAPGGIDVLFFNDIKTALTGNTHGLIIFRKKWHHTNEYGVPTVSYSEATTSCSIKNLPKLIDAVKEAQNTAHQSLKK